jgi:prepilin-type N-terminal cleavage/methylation domain-containing protein
MRSASRTARGERGFTLVELLAVLLILGGLTSVVVLAITRFLGKGTVEAANTELHQARTAIECCIGEAGSQLDIGAPVNWDGNAGFVTATSAEGDVYDASASLRGKRFKATYIVTPTGEITGVRESESEWPDIRWATDHWEK